MIQLNYEGKVTKMAQNYISEKEFKDLMEKLITKLEQGDVDTAVEKLKQLASDTDKQKHYVPIDWN